MEKKSVPVTPPKRNVLKRVITGALLLTYFFTIIYLGPPVIFFHALLVQIKCFDEVIDIAFTMQKISTIPHFRTLNWYFVIVANYYFLGEIFTQHFESYLKQYQILQVLVAYHRFFSFCWYLAGLVWVIRLLKKNVIKRQVSLLVWTHFLLIGISLQTFLTVENMFEGIVWLLMPICLVVVNDIFAYVFGKLLGKTPLIRVSPNKTMEGFIFGGISTFIFGIILSYIFSQFQYFICPIKYITEASRIIMNTNCTPSSLFQMNTYHLGFSFKTYPIVIHSLALSFFASLIAPFGGFCASGFKRACKVKNFGELFPGHGGLMDRLDCQFLMSTFVNVYIGTFIKSSSFDNIYQKIIQLNEDSQLEFYQLLKSSLSDRRMLNDSAYPLY